MAGINDWVKKIALDFKDVFLMFLEKSEVSFS